MSEGPFVRASVDDLPPGETFDVRPLDLPTEGQRRFDAIRAAEVQNIAHGGDCDLTLLADFDKDGSFEASVPLGTLQGEGVSAGNQLEIGFVDGAEVKLRVENSGSEAADYILTGEGVPI